MVKSGQMTEDEHANFFKRVREKESEEKQKDVALSELDEKDFDELGMLFYQ